MENGAKKQKNKKTFRNSILMDMLQVFKIEAEYCYSYNIIIIMSKITCAGSNFQP